MNFSTSLIRARSTPAIRELTLDEVLAVSGGSCAAPVHELTFVDENGLSHFESMGPEKTCVDVFPSHLEPFAGATLRVW